jgi:hypothetical protein
MGSQRAARGDLVPASGQHGHRPQAEVNRIAMTDIEPGADITIGHVYDVGHHRDQDHLVVHIPLADHVDQDWVRWYQRLARVKGISARAEDHPHRAQVIVEVPGFIERDNIHALLDAARALITETDAAVERPPPMAEAEHAVREWWSEQ